MAQLLHCANRDTKANQEPCHAILTTTVSNLIRSPDPIPTWYVLCIPRRDGTKLPAQRVNPMILDT
jgi:hypothetical protein